jgi:GAF domain-containing protein
MIKTECNYCRTLREVAITINSILNPDVVPHSIVKSVAKALGAKGCSLMTLTPDSKALVHSANYGLSEWYLEKGPLSSDKSVSEALHGKSVAIYDAATDERLQYREEAKEEGIASMLCSPMILREEVIGVVRVYTSKPRRFTFDDTYFVETVANLGAIALENARLYDSIKKDRDAFCKDMLEWRTARWKPWMRM